MRTALFVVVLTPALAAAQGAPDLRDLLAARSFAMGGAYESFGPGSETVNGNPAAMSLFKRYQVNLDGAWDPGNKYAWAGSTILDSQTSAVAAGASYHLVTFGQGDDRRTANVSTIAMAIPLADFLHIGVAGKHYLMTGAVNSNAITADAGVVLKLTDAFHLGASAHNLIDVHHPDITRYYVFSAAFTAGLLSAAADFRADWVAGNPAYVLGAGAEYILGNAVPARGGYAYDSLLGHHFFSAGLGFLVEGGGVDVGYRQEIGGVGRMLSISFRLQQM